MHDRQELNEDELESFGRRGGEGPVVMVNLLKFKPGGETGYQSYLRGVAPLLAQVGGELVYAGTGAETLIGRADDGWDLVVLVRYPNRAALLQMVSSDAYGLLKKERAEAVSASVLLATDPARPG